jgi:LacI family transcriptional regulator
MAAKIKDIAKALNISISTVSYALNDGPINVHEDVRVRVIETARELGYRPNRIARSLASGRTMTLGVASFVMTEWVATSSYFQGCLRGIVTEAKRMDYDILLYTHDAEDPDRLVDLMTDGRVDGLIVIAPFEGSPVLGRVAEGNVPVAVVGGNSEGWAPSFNSDNHHGIRIAIEHLVELGHTRIAHVAGEPSMKDAMERLEAFQSNLARFGLPVRQDWIIGHHFNAENSYTEALELLSKPDRPTAIVCASDDNAAGVYRAAWELGVSIPDDLSVVGYDDSPTAEVLLPRLTSVRQPLQQMGAAATVALIELLRKQQAQGRTFETELVTRQSTARPMEVRIP